MNINPISAKSTFVYRKSPTSLNFSSRAYNKELYKQQTVIPNNINSSFGQYGNLITKNAKNEFNRVQKLISGARRAHTFDIMYEDCTKDGVEVAFSVKDNNLYMRETKDGKLQSETLFDKKRKTISSIQTYDNDGKSNIYSYSYGKIRRYYEDIKNGANNALEAKEYVEFDTSGRIKLYGTDVEIKQDKTKTFKELYEFKQGKFHLLTNDVILFPNSKKVAEKIYSLA